MPPNSAAGAPECRRDHVLNDALLAVRELDFRRIASSVIASKAKQSRLSRRTNVSAHGGLVRPSGSTISVGSPKWSHDAFAPKSIGCATFSASSKTLRTAARPSRRTLASAAQSGLLTWGFSGQGLISVFHVLGFWCGGGGVWTGRERRRAHGSRFSGGSGPSRGEARRRRRAWRALDGPEPPEVSTNMRSRARRSAGVGEFAPTAWISAFHEFRLWLFESFDPGPSLFMRSGR